MSYIRGEGRSQGTLFPVVVDDDVVGADHVCRVMDAFVDGLAMAELVFERAEAADTGRPGYDPRDLLKLSVWVSAPATLVAPVGGRVPPQPGVDVAAGPAVSGPQVHRRVPAYAPGSGHSERSRVGAVRAFGGPDSRRMDRRRWY
jgi:hypothetical protein